MGSLQATCSVGLSAWEVCGPGHPPPADWLTCGSAATLPVSDRGCPLRLLSSGTQRARDLQIRSNGRIVHTCPGVAVLWGYVPGVSSFVGSWPRSWQHCWQQSSARSRTVVIGPHSLARLPLGATTTSTVARGRRGQIRVPLPTVAPARAAAGLDLLSRSPFLALGPIGVNHSTSRRDRRPVRGRPVRGITVGCHRPPPCVARLLAPGSLGSGVCWGPGRQPRARAFWARQAIPRTTLPSPVVRIRFLRFPPSMPRDSRAPPWPGSGAQLRLQRPGWLRPHCAVVAACGRCDGRPRRDRGFGM